MLYQQCINLCQYLTNYWKYLELNPDSSLTVYFATFYKCVTNCDATFSKYKTKNIIYIFPKLLIDGILYNFDLILFSDLVNIVLLNIVLINIK